MGRQRVSHLAHLRQAEYQEKPTAVSKPYIEILLPEIRMRYCCEWLASKMGAEIQMQIQASVMMPSCRITESKTHHNLDFCFSGVRAAFMSISSCTTVVIAVERCLCVLFPLKAQTLMSTRTMAILLLTITLLLQLGFTIFPLRMTVIRTVNAQTGRWVWILVPGRGPNQDLLAFLFKMFFDLTLLVVLPLVAESVVVICTVITVVKLKLALTWRLATSTSSNSGAQTQQTALTKMLVVVCCIYVICSTPGCIMTLTRRIDPQYSAGGRYANIFAVTHRLGSTVFSATNSSVNFFVFYARSSRFRQELRCVCKASKNAGKMRHC